MLVFSKFKLTDIANKNPSVSGYVAVPVQNRVSLSYDLMYSVISEISYTGSIQHAMHLGSFKNDDFMDWKSYDVSGTGTDAEAFLQTGHMTFGDSARMKYAPWLTVECLRTEISVSGSVV